MENLSSVVTCDKTGVCFINSSIKLKPDLSKSKACCCCKHCDTKLKTSSNIQLFQGTFDPLSLEVEPVEENVVKILSISQTELGNAHQSIAPPEKNNLASALVENKGRIVQLKIGYDKTVQCRIKNVFFDTAEDGSIKYGGMVLIETGTNSDDKKDQLFEISKIDSLEGVPDNEIAIVGNHIKPSVAVEYEVVNPDKCGSGIAANISYLLNDFMSWEPVYLVTINKDTKTLSLKGKAHVKCSGSNGDTTLSKLILTNRLNININQSKETDKTKTDILDEILDEFIGTSLYRDLKKKRKQEIDVLEEKCEYHIEDIKLSNRPMVVDFIEPLNVDYEDAFHIDVDLMLANKIILFKNSTGHHLTTGATKIMSKEDVNNNSSTTKTLVKEGKLRFTEKGQNVIFPIEASKEVAFKVSVENKELKQVKVKESYLEVKEKNVTLELRNTTNDKVKCVIEANLLGELIRSTPEVSYIQEHKQQQEYDEKRRTKYFWEISIEKQETSELKFSYISYKEQINGLKKPEMYT